MKEKNSITLIGKSAELFKVDVTKISAFGALNVEASPKSEVSIVADGVCMSLPYTIKYKYLKNRLTCIEKLNQIPEEFLNDELTKLLKILMNPENFTLQQKGEYKNIFFSEEEINYYKRPENTDKIDAIFEKIERFNEKVKLEIATPEENVENKKSHLKI